MEKTQEEINKIQMKKNANIFILFDKFLNDEFIQAQKYMSAVRREIEPEWILYEYYFLKIKEIQNKWRELVATKLDDDND